MNWNIKVGAENVCFKSRAEAHGRFGVREALEEAAAGLLRRLAELEIDEPIQEVGAHTELKRVDRARAPAWRGSWLRSWFRFRLRRWRAWHVGGGAQSEEEEVESEEESQRSKGLRSHFWRSSIYKERRICIDDNGEVVVYVVQYIYIWIELRGTWILRLGWPMGM